MTETPVSNEMIEAQRHAHSVELVAAQLSSERIQGWSNPLVCKLTDAAFFLRKDKPSIDTESAALATQPEDPRIAELESALANTITQLHAAVEEAVKLRTSLAERDQLAAQVVELRETITDQKRLLRVSQVATEVAISRCHAGDEKELNAQLKGIVRRIEELDTALASTSSPAPQAIERIRQEALGDTLQSRVAPWMQACFGDEIANDIIERNHRFLEEALELVQSKGCTASEAHQLVDYVFGRAVGEPHQEVGGVMVTLAALCLAADLNMHQAGEDELARVWEKVEQIRAKQAAKPAHSPLPGPSKMGSAT